MKVACILVIVNFLLLMNSAEGGFGWRGASSYKSNTQSKQNTKSYDGPIGASSNGKIVNSTTGKLAPVVNRNSAISAWGIIGLIVGVIMLMTIGYYSFILYPYLCKKQRSYDMIELTDVI